MPNLPPQAFFKAMTPNLVADHISRKNHPDSPSIDKSFHPFFSLTGRIAGRLFKLRKLDNIYSGLNTRADPFEFSKQALDKLGIHLLPTGKCGPIPRKGPLIIVANHPFGCLEGLALVRIISEVRRDVRFLANYFLNALPPLRELFFPVDPFGSIKAGARNSSSVRRALTWLDNGGVLCIFPAGEVAHWKPGQGISDPVWQTNAGRIIHRSGADVQPVYFHGQNTLFFHMAGLLHPGFRTALLPRELLRKKGQTVRFTTGKTVSGRTLGHFQTPGHALAFLRIKNTPGVDKDKRREALRPTLKQGSLPRKRKKTKSFLLSLPAERILSENSRYSVILFKGNEHPAVMHELGYKRALTFHSIGEALDQKIDLDQYDGHYHHLILWSKKDKEIAGGYRVKRADTDNFASGNERLYTSTLFNFSPEFFRSLPQCMELGRSFITPGHQRDVSPLTLLWKAIGTYVNMRPRTRYLFGPVSISSAFSPVSVALILENLKKNNLDPQLSEMVTPGLEPRIPLPPATITQIKSLSELSVSEIARVVPELEEGGHSFPVLIRQYLKLGGRAAAFHHDRDFGSYDVLMVVDLCKTPRATLRRYMGENAENFTNKNFGNGQG